MKLYEVPRKTWVRSVTNVDVPPGAPPIAHHEEIFFDHIDGMYSFCKNKDGEIVHMPAWQEVDICEAPTSIGR